jgi:hypothetical protein
MRKGSELLSRGRQMAGRFASSGSDSNMQYYDAGTRQGGSDFGYLVRRMKNGRAMDAHDRGMNNESRLRDVSDTLFDWAQRTHNNPNADSFSRSGHSSNDTRSMIGKMAEKARAVASRSSLGRLDSDSRSMLGRMAEAARSADPRALAGKTGWGAAAQTAANLAETMSGRASRPRTAKDDASEGMRQKTAAELAREAARAAVMNPLFTGRERTNAEAKAANAQIREQRKQYRAENKWRILDGIADADDIEREIESKFSWASTGTPGSRHYSDTAITLRRDMAKKVASTAEKLLDYHEDGSKSKRLIVGLGSGMAKRLTSQLGDTLKSMSESKEYSDFFNSSPNDVFDYDKYSKYE